MNHHKSAALENGDTGRRVLLVGTAQSVAQLHSTLASSVPGVAAVGCLVVGASPDDLAVPVPILGDAERWESALESHGPVDQVLISLPVAMRGQIQRLGRALDRGGIPWRFMPTLTDQLAGRMQPVIGLGDAGVDVTELIARRPRPLDEESIRETLGGRCVLITGAGGSIGSELARLVCRFDPAKLVLVDRSENSLFEVDRVIGSMFPRQPRAAVLHDVADAAATQAVVRDHHLDVIFHAAAHKHVPMMEDHPAQAVENNFFGTQSVADAAVRYGVKKFVMVSTDKAVNPSSVMGATKRLAELYIQYLNSRSDCVFSMVRFGNVLASACSVLPIWSQQLAQGGPITVTHPDMTRYFMTIPEAAGLVIQSATFSGLSGGGEVFLLDMGQPVRILDLAQRFIRSHGLEPGVDIEIKFTGPRPGEKLFEELAYDGEDMLPTPHESVRTWRTTSPDQKRMTQIITTFERLRAKKNAGGSGWGASREAIIAALRVAVPEMVDAAAAG